MRVTCERCLRRYDVPDATVKGRKIRARCKCGARVVVQDEERAAKSAPGSHTTGSIQRPARWFVDITSWEPIAMDLRQLVRAFDAGRIDADTLVWRKGMPDWRRLRDVAELAERLLGAHVGQKGTAQPVADVSASAAEPSVRQSERSRTPPASYTVGAKPSAETQTDDRPPLAGDEARSSSAARGESTGTLPGFSSGAVERVASLPPAPGAEMESSALPAVARKTRGKPNGQIDSVAGAGQRRTITQTGLSAPPEPNRRFSVPPGASASRESFEAEVAGRPSLSGGSGPRNGRESRNPTLIGAPRRPPSSDETPAQKPSSISVPPGAIATAPQRPRGRRLLAMAAIVVGGVLLAQRFILTDSKESQVQRSASRPGRGSDGQAAKGGIVTQPAALNPETSANGEQSVPPHAAGERDPEASSPGGVEKLPVASSAAVSPPALSAAAGSIHAPAPERQRMPPAPVRQPATAQRKAPAQERARSAQNSPAPSIQTSFPEAASSSASPAEVATTAPGAAKGTLPLSPRPAAADAPTAPAMAAAKKEPELAAPSSEKEDLPSNDPPGGARVFELEQAQQQIGAAAIEAATCAHSGDTRGSGKVNVSIATWGRVVRVKHLNQAFVGTPVGLCVMEAFQKVHVPPFDGSSQTLTGSFTIQ